MERDFTVVITRAISIGEGVVAAPIVTPIAQEVLTFQRNRKVPIPTFSIRHSLELLLRMRVSHRGILTRRLMMAGLGEGCVSIVWPVSISFTSRNNQILHPRSILGWLLHGADVVTCCIVSG